LWFALTHFFEQLHTLPIQIKKPAFLRQVYLLKTDRQVNKSTNQHPIYLEITKTQSSQELHEVHYGIWRRIELQLSVSKTCQVFFKN